MLLETHSTHFVPEPYFSLVRRPKEMTFGQFKGLAVDLWRRDVVRNAGGKPNSLVYGTYDWEADGVRIDTKCTSGETITISYNEYDDLKSHDIPFFFEVFHMFPRVRDNRNFVKLLGYADAQLMKKDDVFTRSLEDSWVRTESGGYIRDKGWYIRMETLIKYLQ